uniref:Transposase MuDR plant domain-containing protein n=1 Tax=Lactuca sativa TaxID=4236 RepID=A0A9R1WLS1_LACSA|nr:hypothetical protein LSAT_V11C100021310 [Lactuca sativa]
MELVAIFASFLILILSLCFFFLVVIDDMINGIEDENDEEAPFDNNAQVPSTFTNMEGTNLNIDDNWIVSQSTSKNDFTRELGKDSFKDKEELVRAIKIHCIKTHRQFKVIESRPTIWTLRCKLYLQSGCKWKLHASKRKCSGYFEIITYTVPHTCLHYKLSQDRLNLDASLIAMETRYLIKAQPSISILALRVEIVETLEIVEMLGYTPSYKKVWVGKQKEIEHVFGNWEESYVTLPKYIGALQKSTDVDEFEFSRVVWAFSPSIEGFHDFRPVISIDVTHLYGKYMGKMLIAMGVEGNNQIFPLAFAIIENKSYDTWNWFVSHVKNHVVKDHEVICLISGHPGGILKAINEHGSPWLESCGFHSFSLSFQESKSNSKSSTPSWMKLERQIYMLEIGWSVIHLIDGDLHMIVEGDCNISMARYF